MDSYEIARLPQLLSANAYPGRGIVVGKSANGKSAAFAYFIMGRSENSRNRIFSETADGIRTEAFDRSKLTDPRLIIYHPVRQIGSHIIVTNGDQTDTIRDALARGHSFSQALSTRCFEPDGPNWTPRISALLTLLGGDFSYQMSMLKSADETGTACSRFTYDYPALAGVGHFLHTYAHDGEPLPSFQGEPVRVAIPDNADVLADMLWRNLSEENKISLYIRYTDLQTGETASRLINKNLKYSGDAK